MPYTHGFEPAASIPTTPAQIHFGTDPELFALNDKGEVVGSELFLPPNDKSTKTSYGKIIRDGVQVELNPVPSFCREIVGYHIAGLIREASKLASLKGLTIDIRTATEMKPDNLFSLSPDVRRFGCDASFNTHFDDNPASSLDGDFYLKRACGGHIHITPPKSIFCSRTLGHSADHDICAQLVPILDIIVGNTCVLFDRDMAEVERRKYYGRAGEYRLPSYGLEYRTLSNFWLHNYTLMSLTFGLTRLAAMILHQTEVNKDHGSKVNLVQELYDRVDMRKVVRAIQENNVDLAWENFEGVSNFIRKFGPEKGIITRIDGRTKNREAYPLTRENVPLFISFAKDVQKRGIPAVFGINDPVQQWVDDASIGYNVYYSGTRGAEAFIRANYTDERPLAVRLRDSAGRFISKGA